MFAFRSEGLIKPILELAIQSKWHAWLPLIGILLLIPTALFMTPTLDDAFHALLFDARLPCTNPDVISPLLQQFIFLDGNPSRTHCLTSATGMPWWTHDNLKIAFLRPISSVTHWFDYQLWPAIKSLHHLHSLLLYALGVLLYQRFNRHICHSTRLAALTTLLFAVDFSHMTAVSWLANRSALIVFIFLLTSMEFLRRHNETGKVNDFFVSCFFYCCTLLSGEMGIGGGAYLLAYCLVLSKQSLSNRLFQVTIFFALSVGWYGAYKMTGYGAAYSGYYTDPGQGLSHFLLTLLERAPYSYFLSWSGLPTLLFHSKTYLLSGFAVIISIVFISLLAAILYHRLRRDRVTWFWLLGSIGSLMPIGAAFPHERNLFLVSIGVTAVIARFALLVFVDTPKEQQSYRVFSVTTKLLCGFMLVMHLLISPLLTSIAGVASYIIHNQTHNVFVQNTNLISDALANGKIPILITASDSTQLPTLTLNAYLQNKGLSGSAYALTSAVRRVDMYRINDNEIRISVPDSLLPNNPKARLSLIFAPQIYDSPLQKRLYSDLSFETLEVSQNGYPKKFTVKLKHPESRYVWLIEQNNAIERIDLPAEGGNATYY